MLHGRQDDSMAFRHASRSPGTDDDEDFSWHSLLQLGLVIKFDAVSYVTGQPKKVSFFVKRDRTLRFFTLCKDTYKVSKSSRSDF